MFLVQNISTTVCVSATACFSPPWLGWPLRNICVTNDHGYVPLVANTSPSFPHSRLITGFVTILLRRVPLVEQELPTLPEYLNSPSVFSGVRVTRSLVLYVCFVDRCLSFCTFSFGHYVVCSSSIYGFWLPLCYLQSLLSGTESFCNKRFLLQYVFLIQNVSATVCVSGTAYVSGRKSFCCSICFWYRTFLLQYVILVQNVSATACVFGTGSFCCSTCFR